MHGRRNSYMGRQAGPRRHRQIEPSERSPEDQRLFDRLDHELRCEPSEPMPWDTQAAIDAGVPRQGPI